MNLLRRFRLSQDRSITVANLVDELLRRKGRVQNLRRRERALSSVGASRDDLREGFVSAPVHRAPARRAGSPSIASHFHGNVLGHDRGVAGPDGLGPRDNERNESSHFCGGLGPSRHVHVDLDRRIGRRYDRVDRACPPVVRLRAHVRQSCTPTATGGFSVTARVTDSNGISATSPVAALLVSPALAAVTIGASASTCWMWVRHSP